MAPSLMDSLPKNTYHSFLENENKDTYKRLIAAAKRVFGSKGYDGATVKDIADEANANVSLVSYYFGGKENLYRACLEDFGHGRVAAAEKLLTQPTSYGDFKTRLRIYTEEFIETHLADPKTSVMIHRDCTLINSIGSEVFKKIIMKAFGVFVNYFQSAKDLGLLKKTVDPLVCTAHFMGGVVHLIRMEDMGKEIFGLSLRDPINRTHVLNQLIDNLLDGIGDNKNENN